MLSRGSKIFIDANAIAGAHQIGCWKSIQKAFSFVSTDICIREAIRRDRFGNRLVTREEEELKAEILTQTVSETQMLRLDTLLEGTVDLHDGERSLLTLALLQQEAAWWLCGPDAATLRALFYISARHGLCSMDQMCALETLTKIFGLRLQFVGDNHKLSEKWLQTKRTQLLLG